MRPLLRKHLSVGTAEFYFRHPENLLRVKREKDGGVLVCATADDLNTEQRSAFVCYLRSEGFVSGVCESSDWCLAPFSDREGRPVVRWIVDPSWPLADPLYVHHLRRLCWCIAGTTMAWLVLMAALVCC